MAIVKAFLEYCVRRREILLSQIELMKGGIVRTGESDGSGPWKDTTADSLEKSRADLKQIERLISEATAWLQKDEEE